MTPEARWILHIDMDAFYASVAQRDDASLRGRPVIVGGHRQRGVVLSASYEARRLGIKSAMPMAQAMKLVPFAHVVAPAPEAYQTASQHIRRIFHDYTPVVEPLSLDEAFLDVTESQSLFGTPYDMASVIRKRIQDELGLTASAGIATVKFVAKIASDFAKPNGQKEVPPEATSAFLAPLPVSRLWGVGPQTEFRLKQLGLQTIGDIAEKSPSWIEGRLGPQGAILWEQSHGRDSRQVVADRAPQSMGAEQTFEEDIEDVDTLLPILQSQAWRVAYSLRQSGMKAKCVQVKLKYSDFSIQVRQQALLQPTDDGQKLYEEARQKLLGFTLAKPVRLIGMSAQNLTNDALNQLSFFDTDDTPREKLNKALDHIASKFGVTMVRPAATALPSPFGDRKKR